MIVLLRRRMRIGGRGRVGISDLPGLVVMIGKGKVGSRLGFEC